MIINKVVSKGFTLIEMAIVLVIIGLLVTGLLTPLSAQKDIKDYTETRQQLEQIKEALYGYAVINGSLPCPTTTADPTNINYGRGDAACPLTAAAGVLPWKDLGVREVDSWGTPRNLAADPWVGYWIYRVDPSFISPITISTTTTASNIDIHKNDGTSLTTATERAVAVVCSTGKNKVADGENASFETANPVYEQDVQSPTFDDMCVWITRPSLFNRMVAAERLHS